MNKEAIATLFSDEIELRWRYTESVLSYTKGKRCSLQGEFVAANLYLSKALRIFPDFMDAATFKLASSEPGPGAYNEYLEFSKKRPVILEAESWYRLSKEMFSQKKMEKAKEYGMEALRSARFFLPAELLLKQIEIINQELKQWDQMKTLRDEMMGILSELPRFEEDKDIVYEALVSSVVSASSNWYSNSSESIRLNQVRRLLMNLNNTPLHESNVE